MKRTVMWIVNHLSVIQLKWSQNAKGPSLNALSRFYAMSLGKDRNSIRKCREHIFQECI